ncbi:unnamed protein product [Vitrella brassicaformis CCMP3155]|uniref:glycerophosphodiester phosphodiesterase n=2 Tax=Vitrella brassicaformis TaxID=1169539 RepID=A0A0G4H3U3_VITBC|nr:unnamed protein product [Vitrella brassicaformis CCMP3155]|mmetsp:Transcript_23398/g.67172  ORF Transcript_23398/g.67172 Transcript_23398/m.67172 type:complete len:364 (-) Transcript_23398:89-1180(-)|eukprot:CEM38207.1 unnamed protein product [Vitrella brassicaformis CCMP3155]
MSCHTVSILLSIASLATIAFCQVEYPLVIAHRGASGYIPEHTLAAYAIAILQGSDYVEPDLVMTKDGHLIARHDNVLDLTTDIAERAEFADRKTTKSVDGKESEGWFSEDFTLEEIKTLRAIERIPETRPANTRFDRMFEVPTLEEIVSLVQAMESVVNRTIGVYPETKHPSHFASLDLQMEEPLFAVLTENGYSGPDAPVFIQSFEVANLQKLAGMTEIPLVQLLDSSGQPFDQVLSNGTLTYDEMATADGLKAIAEYASGVGPEKYHFIMPRADDDTLSADTKTTFVDDAHAAGLVVHPFTFRAENEFLPLNFRNGTDETAIGDMIGEMELFLEAGIDGVFVDHPDIGKQGVEDFVNSRLL